MRSLLELEAFAAIAENLQAYVASISKSDTITLIIPPSPEGAVSSAFLEAALLDSEIPYRRRFSPRSASPPYIEVKDGDALDKPTTHQPNQFTCFLQLCYTNFSCPFFHLNVRVKICCHDEK